METKTTIKDWIPFFSKLVTPLFVLTLIFWFRADVADFIGIVKKAVGEQERSLEIGDWIKIGQRAKTTAISDLNLGYISVSLTDHDYGDWVIEKGDESLIEKLKQESGTHGGKPVDAMILKKGIRYSPVVLEKYVNLLGVRFVLFMGDGTFEGWIPAGLLVGQLVKQETYTYEKLKSQIIGIRNEHTLPTATARDVLQQMQDAQSNFLAVVNDAGQYLYMVSKQDVLAKLVSAMILSKPEETTSSVNG